MNKNILLEKLESSYEELVGTEFNNVSKILGIINKLDPLIREVNIQYAGEFSKAAYMYNMNVSDYTLSPSYKIMKSMTERSINTVRNTIEDEDSLPSQQYFPPNSEYQIQREIGKVIKKAKNSLYIFDNFIDEEILEELVTAYASDIKILCKNQPTATFKRRLNAFKTQYSKVSLEVMTSSVSHDRFFIIDEKEAWILGTSVNHAGTRATSLSKMVERKDVENLVQDFNDWWKKAKSI